MSYLDVMVPLRIDEHARDIRPKYLCNDVPGERYQREMDRTIRESSLPDGFPSRELLEQHEADCDSRVKVSTRSWATDLGMHSYMNASNRLCAVDTYHKGKDDA